MSERITLIVRRALFVSSVLGISACSMTPASRFNLEVYLPANYKLRGDATYVPATGEPCTLRWRPGNLPENKVFDAPGKPEANRVSFEVPLTERVNGCPLVLRYMTFDVYAKSAEHLADRDADFAFVGVSDWVEPSISRMPGPNTLEVPGACQWLLRPVGPTQAIDRVFQCNLVDVKGQPPTTATGGRVQRDELDGKTMRIVFGEI